MAEYHLMGSHALSIRLFTSRAEQAQAVSDWLASFMGDASGNNRTIALAGGNTPLAAYRLLANNSSLSWQDITFMPTDERCVSPDNPRSNLRMLQQTLGDQAIIQPLSENTTPPPLTAVLLGVGEDGHIASLFTETLITDDNGMVSRVAPAAAPEERLTLPLSVLTAAAAALIMLNGKNKWQVLSSPPPPLAAFLSHCKNPPIIYYAD